MRSFSRAALLGPVVLTVACNASTPTNPTRAATAAVTPAHLVLQGTVGVGASATQAFLTAMVTDVNGLSLPNVVVTFATSAGKLSPLSASTDASGTVAPTLTSL